MVIMGIEITYEDLNNVLSFVASCASIIGLFITIGVFFQVRGLKNNYVSRVKVPERLDELDEIQQSIISRLSVTYDREAKNDVAKWIKRAGSIIINVNEKLLKMNKDQHSKEINIHVTNLGECYDKYVSNNTKENAREYAFAMESFTRSARMLMEDYDWGLTQ